MNELLFLGTGAADWDLANKTEGFRRNAAALLNGELMLDCGGHIFDFAETFADATLYRNVRTILITHAHSDHFQPASVQRIAADHRVRLCADRETLDRVGEPEGLLKSECVPYQTATLDGYAVTPLLANHDVVTTGTRLACHYVIQTPDGKFLFYGLDGAWFLRPSWEVMKGISFDLMVLDCTVGDMDDWRLFEHNTIPMLRKMVDAIRKTGMLVPNGRIIASHLARTLHGSHAETQQILAQIGVETAYDNMRVSF